MRLLAKGLSIVVSVGAVAVLGAVATEAAPLGGGWEPTSTPPFVNPAGTVCPFEIKGDIVYDKEYMRISARFPDGSPRVEEFVGALGIRFTNTANGRSAVRDASAGCASRTTRMAATRRSSSATGPPRSGPATRRSPPGTTW